MKHQLEPFSQQVPDGQKDLFRRTEVCFFWDADLEVQVSLASILNCPPEKTAEQYNLNPQHNIVANVNLLTDTHKDKVRPLHDTDQPCINVQSCIITNRPPLIGSYGRRLSLAHKSTIDTIHKRFDILKERRSL